MTPTLVFEVIGKVVSNNQVTRRFNNRSVKNPIAVVYQNKIYATALKACAERKWVKPEACRVVIDAFNIRLDVDNALKCACDGMAGVVYENDKQIIALTIYKHKDLGPERLIICVVPEKPLVKPKKPKKPEPLRS